MGVTGSIAAYKACEILRMLQRAGAEVRVAMTHAAQHFVTPLTFETLSGFEVCTKMFPSRPVDRTRHVKIAEWADCMLICPATANIIGKIASGIADDFLTTAVMAARSRVVIAPAMDFRMVQNPVYLENCEKLKKLGYLFVPTMEGELASGARGPGRLADPDDIFNLVRMALCGSDSLKGVSVLVTAGPTREDLDPVRFLTNHSSGKMGYALASEAALRGARVKLISGPVNIKPFSGVTTVQVTSADEMREAVAAEWKNHKILIMAAAVADFRPAEKRNMKIKKNGSEWKLDLEPTVDILKSLHQPQNGKVTVGFALETENDEMGALKKLKEKKLDLICLNNPLTKGAGFQTDTNQVTLIDAAENREELALMPKWQVAGQIWDRIEKLIKTGKKQG